jgi:nucleoside-diphosphate-sugar epimerase
VSGVVLVTGASGFIGSHCLQPLVERGYDVHAVRRNHHEIPVNGVTWHRSDLLEDGGPARLVAGVEPSHLLHLGWFVTPGDVIGSLDNFSWTEASLALVRAFSRHGGRRLVTSGSSFEYDWSYGYCSEGRTPLRPDTVYGTCKLALGELVEAFTRIVGVSSAWARIFFAYGPREHPDRLVSSVVRSVLGGMPARCSHGEQIRDYLHVQDVADALVALLDSDVEGAVNIGSGEPIALKTIVTALGRQLGRPDLIELGAIPARANDAPLVVADVTRLHDAVGWRRAIALEEGLAWTIEWWRKALVEAPA